MNYNKKITDGFSLPDITDESKLRDDDIAIIMREALSKLYHRFDVRDISKRQGAKGMTLYYLEGYKMIDFMNYYFGLDWSATCESPVINSIEMVDKNGTLRKGFAVTVNCNVSLTLRDKNGNVVMVVTRPGIGADANYNVPDMDKLVKTAMINGIKKAFILMGMTSYLWIAEERDAIEDGLRATSSLTQENIDKISLFSVNNNLSYDERIGLLSDVFKNGVKLKDGTVIKGTDVSVFMHPKQSEIVDIFINKATEMISGNN